MVHINNDFTINNITGGGGAADGNFVGTGTTTPPAGTIPDGSTFYDTSTDGTSGLYALIGGVWTQVSPQDQDWKSTTAGSPYPHLTGDYNAPIRHNGQVQIGTNVDSVNVSMAIGSGNTTSGKNSLATGFNNTASGNGSVSTGTGNTSSASGSVSMGSNNTVSSSNSLASGSLNTASGQSSFVSGNSNAASGASSCAIGGGNTSTGISSCAIGSNNTVISNGGFAAGGNNDVSGTYGAAIGVGNTTSGDYSFATGSNNTASGTLSLVSGANNTASGNGSMIIGGSGTVMAGGRHFAINSLNVDSTSIAAGLIQTFINCNSIGASLINPSAKRVLFGNAPSPINRSSVGIGVDNPTEFLDVLGNTKTSGAFIVSDKQHKQNIKSRDIHEDLNKILLLTPVDYEWIDGYDSEFNSTGRKLTHSGIIAQDLLDVIPTAGKECYIPIEYEHKPIFKTREITTIIDGAEVVEKEEYIDGYEQTDKIVKKAYGTSELIIEPMALISYLIGAVKAQQSQINELKSKI